MLAKRNARFVFDRSRSRKEICPNCGHREYRRFIDRLTGQQLPIQVGVCEKINSCQYSYTPTQWMMDGNKPERPEITKVPPPPPRKTDWRAPKKAVDMTRDPSLVEHCKFIDWFMRVVPDPMVAMQVLSMYRTGIYPFGKNFPAYHGAMVYYQIGDDGLERSGKVIQYDDNGKRRKDLRATWLHSILTGKSMEDIGCAQVLFGEHLLKTRPTDTVCVVEGEKTALICACLYPDKIWLATGGSHGVSASKFMCLVGRDVVMFPDAGMYSDRELPNGQIREGWLSQSLMVEPLCRSMEVCDILEAIGAPDGDDIGDWLVPYDMLKEQGYELFDTVTVVDVVDDFVNAYAGEGLPPAIDTTEGVSITVSPIQRIMDTPGLKALVEECDIDMNRATLKPIT